MFPTSESEVFVVEEDVNERGRLKQWIDSAGLRAHTYRDTGEFLNSQNVSTPELEGKCPGAVLLDLSRSSPGEPAPSCTFRATGINLPVIALTDRGDVRSAVLAMRAGARDVVEKPVDRHELLDRIHRCLGDGEGEGENGAKPDASALVGAPLTPRERQVLDLVAGGQTSKAIGYELGIAQKTVEKHRKHIMEKLNVDSLAHLLRVYWTS